MDIYDLTINQLKRATAVKEQIEKLNKELGSILGGAIKSGAASTKKRTMSASTKKKIAAAQRGRWASLRRDKRATRSGRLTAKAR
jgi:hypothetical protein